MRSRRATAYPAPRRYHITRCDPYDSDTSPLDEVAFPVAGYGAGRHFGRTLGHRRHGGDLAAPIRPSRRQQCAPQRTAWQYLQAHLDRFSRQLFAHVVRIRVLEAPGNLLGRTALGQLRLHIRPQPGIQECARTSGLTGSGCRQRLCRAGTIVGAHRVAGMLAAHGAGRSPQHHRHRPAGHGM